MARLAVAIVPAAFLGVFVVWPIGAVFVRSLEGVGLSRIMEVAGRSSVQSVVAFTLIQALASAALTLAIGLPVAAVLARFRFRGRSLVRATMVVPFVLPTVVVASAISALFDRFGLDANRSLAAILAAHILFNVAVVVRVVGGYWALADRRIEDAARVLGAGWWQRFRRIGLPRLMPVILTASVVVFLFSFTSFGVIRILGGPGRATIETEIYRYAVNRAEFDVAAALAALQLLVVVALAAVSAHLQRRVTGFRGGRSQPLARPPAGWRQHLLLIGGLAIAAVVVVLPLGVLVERSLAVGDGYGIDHYRRLFVDGDLLPVSAIRALANSIWFAMAAMVIASLVGLAAATTVARGGMVGRAFEVLTLVPLGVSAVTLGFGYLVAFTVLDFRRSIWLVPLSHAVIGLPFVLAAVVPALRSIDPRLREAAATLGAPPVVVHRRIDWPLIRTAATTGAGFALAVSLGEFGATSFLARGRNAFTAPLAVFRLMSQPGATLRGQAMALSVIIGALVALVAAIIERRRGEGVTLL